MLDTECIESAMGWEPGSAADDEDNAKFISELQETVNSDAFMPMKPYHGKNKKGEDVCEWVENADCKDFMDIKLNHGEEVAKEVKRAWWGV